MTIRIGTPGYPRIAGTRAGGTGTPARRDGARPPAPAQRRTAADDMDSWLKRGARATSEPDLFFSVSPEGASAASQRQIAQAQAVCRRCPVIEDCRTCRLANPRMSEHGVWAATTEEERRSARRKADRAAGRAKKTAPHGRRQRRTDRHALPPSRPRWDHCAKGWRSSES